MESERQKLLIQRHGRILARLENPPAIGGSQDEIVCGDGWFDLIDVLCARMQFHTDVDGAPQVVALQVKEKFGTLRFYADGADEIHTGMIDVAQAMSERTCGSCGGHVPCPTCSRAMPTLRTAGTR